MNYINKYNKYSSKCNTIIDVLNNRKQHGGKKDFDKKVYIEKLYKIKEKVKKQGYVFWFDSEGKLLVKDLDDENAQNKMLGKIKKNIKKWENQIVTEVTIDFDKDKVMDKESGGLQIDVYINKVIINGKNISMQQKDENSSILTLYYSYDELDDFKMSDIKKIVLMMVNKKMKKVNAFKFYHYCDIEKYLE